MYEGMPRLRLYALSVAAGCVAAASPALATTVTGTLETHVADHVTASGTLSHSRTSAMLTTRDGTVHELTPSSSAVAETLEDLSGLPARVTVDADGNVRTAAAVPGVRAAGPHKRSACSR